MSKLKVVQLQDCSKCIFSHSCKSSSNSFKKCNSYLTFDGISDTCKNLLALALMFKACEVLPEVLKGFFTDE